LPNLVSGKPARLSRIKWLIIRWKIERSGEPAIEARQRPRKPGLLRAHIPFDRDQAGSRVHRYLRPSGCATTILHLSEDHPLDR
jgi:hypothetical protein